MHQAIFDAIVVGEFKTKPTQWFAAQARPGCGAVLVGDSLNMRHPVTGGGMTAALTDVQELGKLLESVGELNDADRLSAAITRFYNSRNEANATINILADALFGVFSNQALRRACFEYLRQGGASAEGPMSILSGLSRDKGLLLKHFFSVAAFGAKKTIRGIPTASRVKDSYRLISDAVNIIGPLIEQDGSGPLTKAALRLGKVVFPAGRDEPITVSRRFSHRA
jgi:squalene monooxygenase